MRASLGMWMALVACGTSNVDSDSAPPTGGETDTDTDTDTDTVVVDPCLLPVAIVELGAGDVEANYRAIAPGDPVTMVHGPQGGWHIDMAATIRSPTPDVSVHPTASDAAGNQLAGSANPVFLALAGYNTITCEGKVFGQRALLLDYEPPADGMQLYICSLEGQPLTMGMDVVELATGAIASGVMLPTAALDPVDVPVCP